MTRAWNILLPASVLLNIDIVTVFAGIDSCRDVFIVNRGAVSNLQVEKATGQSGEMGKR